MYTKNTQQEQSTSSIKENLSKRSKTWQKIHNYGKGAKNDKKIYRKGAKKKKNRNPYKRDLFSTVLVSSYCIKRVGSVGGKDSKHLKLNVKQTNLQT